MLPISVVASTFLVLAFQFSGDAATAPLALTLLAPLLAWTTFSVATTWGAAANVSATPIPGEDRPPCLAPTCPP